MPPPPHTKPENVLKRAQELIGVGQSQAALSLLHEHVTSKRTRNSPIASLEPVMILFVELCVELRKGKSAKDGLYSYKNTAQNTNVGTIEMVLKKFIELAEQKVTEAQAKADEVQSTLDTTTTTANIDDLEASETPESILLSTVSGEQSRDRTDRAIVTPWLKFLWETYRTVLDILKNNARLEILYQATAHQAFSFCLKYTRKTEFRRLCELLRNHLQNAAKYQSQIHAINLSDPDTLQRHLDTRFQQLNVAVELELWQEAFRSVEDIHTLLNLSKRPAKPLMMANYFEKLSTIFLVSENYLFHAASYIRYFNLLRSSAAAVASGQSAKKDNPVVNDSDLSSLASFVILSALSIPVISTSRSRGALVDVDEARKNKNQRLTNLLGLTQAPSRALLFKEILSKGLLKRARPEIRQLYNIMEVDFHPLSICKKISPILSQIGADPEMGKYVLPLQQVILTRLFQQLSQVYESVELKFVVGLAQFPQPFEVSGATIEKFIMNGCKKGDLAIRVDHATGVLNFDTDIFSSAKALHPSSGAGSAESEVASVQRLQSTPAEIVRSQLTRLAKSLYVTCQYVDPSFSDEQRLHRAQALERAVAGAEKEHTDALERRGIIEKRKAAAATAAAQKSKEEETRKRVKLQQAEDAERQRLAEEQRERDQRRLNAEKARVAREEVEKQLKELKSTSTGIDISNIDLDTIDTQRLRQMKISQLEKEKADLSERLRVTSKRVDHLERAFRREELKYLPADLEAQRQRDLTEYETTKTQTLEESKLKHTDDVALKNRLARLVDPYEDFTVRVRKERSAEFEKRKKAAAKEYAEKKQARIREHRERKAREQREREAQEQAEREEREREEREAQEKAAAEEERRRKMAEEKALRDEQRRAADEQAAKQRQREEEAEARRLAAKGAARAPPTLERERDRPSPAVEAPTGTRPPLFGSGGGWREREAARLAAEANQVPAAAPAPGAPPETDGPAPIPPQNSVPAQAPAPAKPSTGGSGYVPPHLRRAGADGASATPPPTRSAESPAGDSDRWRPGSRPGARDENAGSRYSAPTRGAPIGGSRPNGFGADRERVSSPAAGKDMERTSSGRDGVDGGIPPRGDSTSSPAPGAPGKYVPKFRRAQ